MDRPMMVRDSTRLDGVEEHPPGRVPAFRVGHGNRMLTHEWRRPALVQEATEIVRPIPGGWGKMGHTHRRLPVAATDVVQRSNS
jgi:hypothetical protein